MKQDKSLREFKRNSLFATLLLILPVSLYFTNIRPEIDNFFIGLIFDAVVFSLILFCVWLNLLAFNTKYHNYHFSKAENKAKVKVEKIIKNYSKELNKKVKIDHKQTTALYVMNKYFRTVFIIQIVLAVLFFLWTAANFILISIIVINRDDSIPQEMLISFMIFAVLGAICTSILISFALKTAGKFLPKIHFAEDNSAKTMKKLVESENTDIGLPAYIWLHEYGVKVED